MFYAVILFAGSVLISRGTTLSLIEERIFFGIYDLPSFLKWPFLIITQLGSIYTLGVIALLYLLANHYHKLLRLLLTGFLAYLTSGFAKDIWGRGRPFEFLSGVENFEYIVRGPGFPSGHMALATALALTVGHYVHRKYHWLIVAWIVLVGLSRVYLGVHLPVDIIGGFAIGWGSFALFMQIRLYDTTKKRRKK